MVIAAAEVDQIIDKYEDESGNNNGRRGILITLLQKVQERLGYLPLEAMEEIAKIAGVSTNTVYGVATFYSQFRFMRPGEHTVKVCLGTACHVHGAERITEALERELGIETGDVTPDHQFGLEKVRCFGSCALAPVIVVDEKVYGRMTSTRAKQVLDQFR